jgi:predicted metal-dependent phosphoesterase TrpH
MRTIDLHTHSTASDGSLHPAELMRQAKTAGLSAIALSDHDTIGGLAEAHAEADAIGLELVPAIEVSLSYSGSSLHMLGYLIDYKDPALLANLVQLGKRRSARNDTMIEKFAGLGIAITPEELLEAAGGIEQAGVVGRPHFAKLLIARGIVKSFDEAFDKYLGKNKPAYVPKTRLDPEDGIALIHKAGGVAVLAHPKYCGADTPAELEDLLMRLKAACLDGIECLYTDHNQSETATFLSLAKRHSLAVTGGTDFHGDAKPNATLGRLPGGRSISYSFLEDLKAVRAKRHA